MNEVNYIDTTLRDGQMSLWATGMRTDMILPIAATMDQAGFAAIEIMATGFEKKMVRELREDPWERIDLVRRRIQKTPLRMIRGRYMAAFHITPRSIEDLWYERLVAHGIRQVRISDSSNTAAGWREQVRYARSVGIDPIVNLIFSISPKHTDEYYAQKARDAAKLDVYRICLKDPGGLLTPERIKTLVPVVLGNTKSIPVELHTHCNTGLGPLSTLEAIKLGIRYVNAAIPPLSDSSSNPSLFNVIKNARAFGYTSTVDDEFLKPVEQHFTSIAKREGLPIGAPAQYDCSLYVHQVPGGMVSNLRHQLSTSGLAGKIDAVLEEIGKVRADFGYPIMVTPYSQFVGVQATMNVISGERYKLVSDEVIQYALGFWGEEECSSIVPNVRDRILDRHRARELAQWQPPQPNLNEVRREYGGAGVSDDEMLLRYFAGEDQVAAMRAAGPSKKHDGTGHSLVSLIEELTKRTKFNYIQVQKGAMSLTLQGRRDGSYGR
ncbi:MAG: biotin carboxyl carrier protein [Betaproteobacteria bacterium]|nr:biotin carboxyl carrier protein [Betaproteobacteria bacterium]